MQTNGKLIFEASLICGDILIVILFLKDMHLCLYESSLETTVLFVRLFINWSIMSDVGGVFKTANFIFSA